MFGTQLADLDIEDFNVAVRVATIERTFAAPTLDELGMVKGWPVAVPDRAAAHKG